VRYRRYDGGEKIMTEHKEERMNPQDRSIHSCPTCGKKLYWMMNFSYGDEAYYCFNCRDWFDDYEIEPELREPFNIVPIEIEEEETPAEKEPIGYSSSDNVCDLILFEEDHKESSKEQQTESQLRKCEVCGFYSCRCKHESQKISFFTNLKTKLQYYISIVLKKLGYILFEAGTYLRQKGNNQYDKSISKNPRLSEKLYNKKVKNIEIKNGGSL
jgi:hypothetical protein